MVIEWMFALTYYGFALVAAVYTTNHLALGNDRNDVYLILFCSAVWPMMIPIVIAAQYMNKREGQ